MGSRKPNIILITFDSGRSDHMGFLGYPKDTTPFLDLLAKKGVVFQNAFSTGPGSSVSFVGMMTSTYPLDYGGYSYVDKPRVLISEVLKNDGYTTIGVHSSAYLSGYFGYNRGWDVFCYANYFSKDGASINPGLRRDTMKAKVSRKSFSFKKWLDDKNRILSFAFQAVERILLLIRKLLKDAIDFKPAFFTAEEINKEVATILEKKRAAGSLFLWVHYLDAHAPYGLFMRKGRGFASKLKYHLSDILSFIVGDVDFINRIFKKFYLDIYDESLRYVDRNIRDLFEYLRTRGVLDDKSIVAIAADHGETFSDHGQSGHSQVLFNENIKVPLIFYSPKLLSPSVKRTPVSLIDLSPTILKLAGTGQPAVFKGKSVFEGGERPVISQASECEGDLSGAVFTGATAIYKGYKLIHWKNKKMLFSLHDTKEENDLYDERKDVARAMEKILLPYEKVDFAE